MVALAAGTATAARADAYRHRDPTGDVLVSTAGSSSPVRTLDHSQRRPDIQKLTVLHTRWTVSVATTLRGLDGIDDTWTATVVTSKGDRFRFGRAVSTGASNPSMTFVFASRNGYHFTCDGITTSRTSSGVIAKVPTRCLGNPWKVRVGDQADTTYNEIDDVNGYDDALRAGAFTDSKPALSPWIQRSS